ncbi:MAG: hypothetical protein EPO23_03380 [Xanthobacteraceae bacterium]|nr:MAG: hypothetical protein EPO23_03380 [Xanthobacteraceae bacterium]
MAGADIEIAGALVHETPRAILFSDKGEEASAVWIPRGAVRALHPTGRDTVITLRGGQKRRVAAVIITVSEHTAYQKGLI